MILPSTCPAKAHRLFDTLAYHVRGVIADHGIRFRNQRAQEYFFEKLYDWSSPSGFYSFDLDDSKFFDRAILLVTECAYGEQQVLRTLSPASFKTYLFAQHHAQAIDIYSGTTGVQGIEDILMGKTALSSNLDYSWSRDWVGHNTSLRDAPLPNFTRWNAGFGFLESHAIRESLGQMAVQFVQYFDRHFSVTYFASEKDHALCKAHVCRGFYHVIASHFQDAFDQINENLDLESLKRVDSFKPDRFGNHTTSLIPPLHIYNHVVRAKSGMPRFRRAQAMALLQPSGQLFEKSCKAWDAIDAGASPYAAFGEELGASAGTIREMLHRIEDDYSIFAKDFSFLAPYLHRLDRTYWPEDVDNVGLMTTLAKAAHAYSATFSRDSGPVMLAQWVRDAGQNTSWPSLFTNRFRTPHASTDHLHLEACLHKYTADLRGIGDMKRAMTRHLVLSALLLRMPDFSTLPETRRVDLLKNIERRLWQNCPPSEQIAASAYWHSPRVNFNARVSSVTQTLGMSWHTIIDQPVSINGVTFVPLGSDDALREEAAVMKHCVWSYGPYCLKNGYHIFSLRDRDGRHLSTLTLEEEWMTHYDGVIFTPRYNLSVSNARAPELALDATGVFVDRLNGEEFSIDWPAIKADRAAFAAKEMVESVGFDFRDPAVMQHMFDLYEPCLPRKLSRASGGTPDGFARALGIPELIAAQLAPTGDGAALRPRLG